MILFIILEYNDDSDACDEGWDADADFLLFSLKSTPGGRRTEGPPFPAVGSTPAYEEHPVP